MSISIADLELAGYLPGPSDAWPPPVRWVTLPGLGSGAVLRSARPPGPPDALELVGLPGPDDQHIDVLIERQPLHQAPGRWRFCCPACGRPRGTLVRIQWQLRCPACGRLKDTLAKVELGDDAPRASAAARTLGWACRRCAGRPASRASSLARAPAQWLDHALGQAVDGRRRPGETVQAWRRRRERGARVIAHVWATDPANPILVQAIDAVRTYIDRHAAWRGGACRPTLHGWCWTIPTSVLPISHGVGIAHPIDHVIELGRDGEIAVVDHRGLPLDEPRQQLIEELFAVGKPTMVLRSTGNAETGASVPAGSDRRPEVGHGASHDLQQL